MPLTISSLTEMPRQRGLPALPPGWEILRDKVAGRVRYALAGAPGGTAG